MIDKDILSGNENIYLSMNDTAIAHIARNNIVEPSSETLGYIHSDHLGGSSIITDIRGTIQVQRDYYPFGETRIDESLGTPNFNTKYQFTGQEKDEGTGLYYYHARYYHPEIGRFISVDPVSRSASEKSYFIEPQRWNQYAYVRNNPIALIDPTGLLDVFVHGTWSDGNTWDKDFIDGVKKTLGTENTKTAFVNWGKWNNNTESRGDAADQLIGIIKNHIFAENEKLNIIGHSHGGNVIIEGLNKGFASGEINRSVDNVMLFATPVRNDYKFSSQSLQNTSNIYNVYDPKDNVQSFLSCFESGFGSGNSSMVAGHGQIRNEKGVKNIGVSAKNLGISFPFGFSALSGLKLTNLLITGISKHVNMHSLDVWNQFVRKAGL